METIYQIMVLLCVGILLVVPVRGQIAAAAAGATADSGLMLFRDPAQPVDKRVDESVTLSFPAVKLAFYSEAVHNFVVEPGAFDIMVGSASDDIRLSDQVIVSQ